MNQNNHFGQEIKKAINYANNLKYDLAIKVLNKLKLKFPKYENIYTNLGHIFDQKAISKKNGRDGLFIQATSNFKKALKINSSSIDALSGLGTVYLHKNKNRIALKYYLKAKKSLRNKKDNLIVINNLANCYRRLKDYKKAQFFYEKVININPDFYIGYYNLAILFYYDLKKFSKAKIYAKKGIELLNKEKETKLLKKFGNNLKKILER